MECIASYEEQREGAWAQEGPVGWPAWMAGAPGAHVRARLSGGHCSVLTQLTSSSEADGQLSDGADRRFIYKHSPFAFTSSVSLLAANK